MTWTSAQVASGYLYAVSCPGVSLCVAVDQLGDVVTSTSPLGGPAAWTVTPLSS
ncbi:MAG: hypothetical protein QOH66_2889 [Actinomycetota bacterium]|nr:hypothetical protein [Actinomycetota bacterium]